MASEIDFLEMYRTLGLRPGCGMPDLKLAYRRYVARQHPDRRGDASADPVADARLQRLIAQFDAAMAFEREHGRLPGSASRARFAVPEASVQMRRPKAAPRRGSWRRTTLVLSLLAISLGMLWWDMATQSPLPAATDNGRAADSAPAQVPAQAKAQASPVLALGLTAEQVREIEGEPTGVRGDRWEYGPSWVRFEDDHVVEWHNSPLHSLGPVGRSPDAAEDTSSAMDH